MGVRVSGNKELQAGPHVDGCRLQVDQEYRCFHRVKPTNSTIGIRASRREVCRDEGSVYFQFHGGSELAWLESLRPVCVEIFISVRIMVKPKGRRVLARYEYRSTTGLLAYLVGT